MIHLSKNICRVYSHKSIFKNSECVSNVGKLIQMKQKNTYKDSLIEKKFKKRKVETVMKARFGL